MVVWILYRFPSVVFYLFTVSPNHSSSCSALSKNTFIWSEVCADDSQLSKQCCADNLQDFVAKLRVEHAAAFQKLREHILKPGCLTTPKGGRPAVESQCWLCRCVKHRVAWQYKQGEISLKTRKTGRVTTGGACYACVKSSQLLKITRSKNVLKQTGLEKAVLALSKKVRENLAEKDFCSCFFCKTKWDWFRFSRSRWFAELGSRAKLTLLHSTMESQKFACTTAAFAGIYNEKFDFVSPWT